MAAGVEHITSDSVVHIVERDLALCRMLVELVHSMGLEARGYASGAEFLAGFQPHHPGCLLLELHLQDMSGFELQQRLQQLGSALPLIFMAAGASVAMAVRALKAGAIDFLEKPIHSEQWQQSIESALLYDRQRQLAKEHRADVAARVDALTVRERDVLEMLLDGLPNKVIAAREAISERAVEMRRAAIMRKLRVHSLAELIRLVTRYELTGTAAAVEACR